MEHSCKICSSYHNYHAPCFDREPVCSHGQLARQCPLCELEAEVAALKRERDRIHQDVHDRDHTIFNFETAVETMKAQLRARHKELSRMRPVFRAAVAFIKNVAFESDGEPPLNTPLDRHLDLGDAVRKLDR